MKIHYTGVRAEIPDSVNLIVVTKDATLDQMKEAYAQGARHFGESRVELALEKMQQLPNDIQWHLIGSLQSKKVPKVMGKFALIHSVDSLKLAEKIAERGEGTKILLQVNITGEESKHGFSPQQLQTSYSQIRNLRGVEVEGLMTMAPKTSDGSLIRTCFADLKALRDALDPSLFHLSMGMSGDYRIAIEEGATLIRLGSKIFPKEI